MRTVLMLGRQGRLGTASDDSLGAIGAGERDSDERRQLSPARDSTLPMNVGN